MINENNARFNKNQKYIIFDTETEGLNLVNHRPFQLSWIVCDNFKILETHDRYIYWDNLSISEDAKKITKFDLKSYKEKAEPPECVYNDFKKYLFDENTINVCQNIFNFDCYMIKNIQKELNIKIDFSYLKRSVDTKCLFIAMQKNITYNERDSFFEWQFKISNIKEKNLKSSQKYMLDFFDIKYEDSKLHGALYDIKMLYEIFRKLSNNITIPVL